MESLIKIRCPRCAWKPDGGAHWSCMCGHVWNTFETQGQCPACARSWKHTCCPGPGYPGGCGEWSLHEDWYEGLEDWLEEAMSSIQLEAEVEAY